MQVLALLPKDTHVAEDGLERRLYWQSVCHAGVRHECKTPRVQIPKTRIKLEMELHLMLLWGDGDGRQ